MCAQIVERNILRYTPAGLPVYECVLAHSSTQIEAGLPRQIELSLSAVALGPVAVNLDRAPLATLHRFTGFLARKSRKSKSFIYHITAYALENEE